MPLPTPLPDEWAALVLAAGKGTRMRSQQPKVLFELLGEPMLAYVHDALEPLFGDRVWTVVGHAVELVERAFPQRLDRFILQQEQRGTGHAVQTAWPQLQAAGVRRLLVINGDTPLITPEDLDDFIHRANAAPLAFLSASLHDPGAFGRVVREDGKVAAIVEAKDFDTAIHGAITGEINVGCYAMDLEAMTPLLARLDDNNASGEFYITDLVALSLEAGLVVEGVLGSAGHDVGDEDVLRLLGVNNPRELVRAEEHLRRKLVDAALDAGVLVRSPESVRMGPRAVIEPGAEITGPSEILGASRVEAGARIASHTVLQDAHVAAGAEVHHFSTLQGARVGEHAAVGPYARLRPGATLGERARVGNFVELKNASLGPGSKANHLSYLGDAEVGAGANIGAGTITCNYDGRNKFRTTVGAGAFIGSNAALVAPVTVGEDALVAAGSTITEDVPANALAVARGRQSVKEAQGMQTRGKAKE